MSLTLGAFSHWQTQAHSLQNLLTCLWHLHLRIALRSIWGIMDDGSLVRLLAGLGAFPLRWPAFSAEVVSEVRTPVSCPIFNNMYLVCPSPVWEAVGVCFVQVFHDGTVLSVLEWVQLDEFVGRLRALVPDQLFEQCTGD